MALTTRYPGQIVIAESVSNLEWGTVMLGTTYGSLESATVTRDGDLEKLQKAGGKLLAVIMSNMLFKLDMKCLFSSDVTPPDVGDLVTFPLAGIKGRVLPGIKIDWEKDGHRMLSFSCESWDSFSSTNQGGGNAYTYEGGTFTSKT